MIEPDSKPEVFNSSNDVVTALKNEQIDAVVVDLPTALYLTAVQVPTATVVGQFAAPGGDQWGALLAKGIAADRLRLQGGRRTRKLRRAGSDQQALDEPGRRRPRTALAPRPPPALTRGDRPRPRSKSAAAWPRPPQSSAIAASNGRRRGAARQRRGQAIAAVSTVVVLGGLAAWVLTSPGWPVVRETFFSWSVFKEAFPEVLEGFWLDVKLFVIVEIAVLVVGLVIALVRTSRAAGALPAAAARRPSSSTSSAASRRSCSSTWSASGSRRSS